MATDNVAVVRSIFDSAAQDELEGMLSPVSEEITIHDTTRVDGGVYHGFDGLMDWMAEWSETYDWDIRADEYVEADDSVVAIGHWDNVARASGIKLKTPFAMVFRLRDGLVVRLDYFNDSARALEAAGAARAG